MSLTLQPTRVATGRDEAGLLVYAEGRLVAVLVHLPDENEVAPGDWYLEAGFGSRLDGPHHPTFASLEAAQDWIVSRIAPATRLGRLLDVPAPRAEARRMLFLRPPDPLQVRYTSHPDPDSIAPPTPEVTPMPITKIARRDLMTGISALAILGHPRSGWADSLPPVTVSKDPTCGCCNGWVEHLRDAGFRVNVMDTPQLALVKKRYGVPDNLASCHTAEVAGYVVEGHVPVAEVKRLLAERPQANGLAVAGMPMGSPGIEMHDMADPYEVILFGPLGRRTFARYKGGRAL